MLPVGFIGSAAIRREVTETKPTYKTRSKYKVGPQVGKLIRYIRQLVIDMGPKRKFIG